MATIFLDLETTGLDPYNDAILEIAALRVEGVGLEPVDGFHAIVKPLDRPAGAPPIDQVVIDMHTRNGLWVECEAQGQGQDWYRIVAPAFVAWLERQGPGPHTLAGDSVHFDLGFLRAKSAAAAAMFSHRLLDVSAFRVARDLLGLPPCEVAPSAHRAQSDVLASICKARWHLSRVAP